MELLSPNEEVGNWIDNEEILQLFLKYLHSKNESDLPLEFAILEDIDLNGNFPICVI